MKLGYFPGCSLHGSGREFDESLKAIAAPLSLELDEIKDWSCCGATSAHATDHLLSVALGARNLSLAEAQGAEKVMAPCAACFSRLATARHELGRDEALATRVRGMLERPFTNRVEVLNVLTVLRELTPQIKQQCAGALSGMKVACYYGCLLVRPAEIAGPDDPEHPTSMEQIASATGATPVEWNRKVECCGGSFSLARTGSVVRLGRSILEDAKAAGADVVVVACPMCHSNLDLRQAAMAQRGEELGMPILYLTQLVGLGLRLAPEALGLGRHFVSTRPVTARWPAPNPAAAKA